MNKAITCFFALAAAMLLCGCESPLNKAAQRGDTAQVQQLLDKGANINSRSAAWGSLPLICAAGSGKTMVVEQLLGKGANIDAKDCQGWTALALASYRGHTECVRVLLEHGANTEIGTTAGIIYVENQPVKTALDLAQENGHTEIVQLIEAKSRKGNNPTMQPSVPTTLLPPSGLAAPF
jgi:ankyrin repeat protein